jgi:hypothetical protein
VGLVLVHVLWKPQLLVLLAVVVVGFTGVMEAVAIISVLLISTYLVIRVRLLHLRLGVVVALYVADLLRGLEIPASMMIQVQRVHHVVVLEIMSGHLVVSANRTAGAQHMLYLARHVMLIVASTKEIV